MQREIVELTEKLIKIPSFVDGKTDETRIGNFVYQYLRQNCPWLKVRKQMIQDQRFNVVAADGRPTKLLICGHLDTVMSTTNWGFNPFNSFIKSGHLFGLGAVDMKGSLAAFLTALKSFSETRGLLLLFYVDEEYNFAGMRKFVADYSEHLLDISNPIRYKIARKPELIFSIDGGDLKIGFACRGLIDLDFEVIGKSAHAALPQAGVNAILAATRAVESLSKILKNEFSDSRLGPSVCNLAFLETSNKSRNVIPGMALAKLEIRPARASLKSKKIAAMIARELKKQGARLGEVKVLNDLEPMISAKEKLVGVEKIIAEVVGKVKYLNPAQSGYGDVAMLFKKYKAPTAAFGPGPMKMAHQANEYVYLRDLEKCFRVYLALLNRYCFATGFSAR